MSKERSRRSERLLSEQLDLEETDEKEQAGWSVGEDGDDAEDGEGTDGSTESN